MAQVQHVEVYDDLEFAQGKEVHADAGTIQFGLDGKSYEIDLSTEHATTLRDILAEFIAAARRGASTVTHSRKSKAVDGLPKDPPNAVSRPRRERNIEIREWATGQGMNISPRGRISDEIVTAFYRAHSHLVPIDEG